MNVSFTIPVFVLWLLAADIVIGITLMIGGAIRWFCSSKGLDMWSTIEFCVMFDIREPVCTIGGKLSDDSEIYEHFRLIYDYVTSVLFFWIYTACWIGKRVSLYCEPLCKLTASHCGSIHF